MCEDSQVASKVILFTNKKFGIKDQTFNKEHMVERIVAGYLFGFVECYIVVPDELEHKSDKMCPIFKNIQEYAERTGRLHHPQSTLIGSRKGDKMLLATAPLKKYIKQSLKVVRVSRLFKCTPSRCLKSLFSDARRDSYSDPNLALLDEKIKLVGISLYAKTITNK